jgi:hypothetical protein
VEWVTTLTVRHGFLTILADQLIFLYSILQEKSAKVALKRHELQDNRRLVKEWPLSLLKEIHRRRYLGRKNALELKFLDGNSLFFHFANGEAEDLAHKLIRLRKSRCSNLVYEHKTLDPRRLIEKDGVTKRWVNREISNLEYLMYLNTRAGRSFKDLAQYPVMPWVLADYKSEKLNLADPASFRDLSKPMGALGPESRQKIFREKFENPDAYSDAPPFHYGTHYSSAGTVLHFLLRMQPYTEGAKLFQGGKFDIADRIFYSVKESYNYATSEPADVRELIP